MYDPWAQANSALSNLGDSFVQANQMQRQQESDLQTKRLADLQFNDAQAKQNATMQASGAPDLTTAYANEMERQKQQQILEHKQKGFQTYLSTIGVLDKMPNLDPQTKTAIGKEFLRQNPEFAPMVDNLKFIDSKGVKAARNFGEGELKDPSTGQPLPAGYYETEGVWTGDVANPVKLTAYKLASPPKVDHIPEGNAIPDGKGGYTVPAPKAEKADRMQVVEIPSPDGKTAQKYSVNTIDGTKTPIGNSYKVNSQVPRVTVSNNGTSGDNAMIAAWADKIATGQSALTEIPGRGPIRSQVVQYLAKNYPEVNLAEAGARRKWTQDKGTMQTLALVDATKGVLNDMRGAYAKLNRTDIPGVNAAQDVWQKWSGNPDRSEYMSLKNYGIQEVEKMLSGSGAMSDHRIKLAFDNLKESNTPDQFERAVTGIERVMSERERATREGPYKGSSSAPAATAKPSPKGTKPRTASDYLSKW